MRQQDMRKTLMKTGVFKTQTDATVYLLAHLLSQKNEPLGCWSLKVDLDACGVECSTATIGRYLKLLDSKEYTIQRSNKGRLLTPAGSIWLKQIEKKLERARMGDDITKVVHINGYDEMVDLMRVRKLIEVDAARLAAENANQEDLKRIDATLVKHHDFVKNNLDPVEPALDFHLAVAQASHNKFMFAVLSLLSFEEKQIESTIKELRTRELGSVYVVEHDHIAQAIRNRTSEEAARLMEKHMQDILSNVEQQVAELDENGGLV